MEVSLCSDWKFSLKQPAAPHLSNTADEEWDTVQLPHDWSVAFPFSQENTASCTGFLPGGLGWYRKHITTTSAMLHGTVYLLFDGVYNNASYYVNGHFAAFHPYGYSPFALDLTGLLHPVGKDNVIAVQVDRMRYADSRWYTGSGIYRNVTLCVYPLVHIEPYGLHIQSQLMETSNIACVTLRVLLHSNCAAQESVQCSASIKTRDGRMAATDEKEIRVSPGTQTEAAFTLTIQQPLLWDTETPNLYVADVALSQDGQVIQRQETSFGVRDIRFDADKGFFLNGRHTLIQGVCLHHEAGSVGAAVPDAVWIRRLKALKACGCNAIRTAHNPSSSAFLDLCDQIGFMVLEEFFDEWHYPKDKFLNNTEQSTQYITQGYSRYFHQWAKRDLQSTVRRDRNHPSIILWSIGNEIEWTYPKFNNANGYFENYANGSYFWTLPPFSRQKIRKQIAMIPIEENDIADVASGLAHDVRELDQSRPVTANMILPSVSYETGFADVLDIAGYSYRRVIYDYGHTYHPHQPIVGTENVAQWHEWKAVLERPFVAGIFLWTGIDYLGEVHQMQDWPMRATNSGLLDTAGFPRPSYFMMKSLWTQSPMVYVCTQKQSQSLYGIDDHGNPVCSADHPWQQRLWYWHDMNRHWNYEDGEMIVVEAYTNCEYAELFVNQVSRGKQTLADNDDHILKWTVRYEPGEIYVKAYHNEECAQERLVTAGEPVRVALTAERYPDDKDPICQITAQLVDKEGNPVRHTEKEVFFSISSQLKAIGIDNGDFRSVQAFPENHVETKNGRCLLTVKAMADQGDAIVEALFDRNVSAPARLLISL